MEKKKLPGSTIYSIPTTTKEVRDYFEKMPGLRKEYKVLKDELERRYNSLHWPLVKSTDYTNYPKARAEFERKLKELKKAIK